MFKTIVWATDGSRSAGNAYPVARGLADAEFRSAKAPAGNAAPQIAQLAEEAAGDLIVAGSRGHGPVTGLLLGSVATRRERRLEGGSGDRGNADVPPTTKGTYR